MSEELKLEGWGGQECSVHIVRTGEARANSRTYVEFRSEPGYGYPSLEISEMRRVLAKMEAMDD